MAASFSQTPLPRTGAPRLLLAALLAVSGVHLLWLATGWGGPTWREVLADLLPVPSALLAALWVGRVAARHRERGARRG